MIKAMENRIKILLPVAVIIVAVLGIAYWYSTLEPIDRSIEQEERKSIAT